VETERVEELFKEEWTELLVANVPFEGVGPD
jgi:hypothetical protein